LISHKRGRSPHRRRSKLGGIKGPGAGEGEAKGKKKKVGRQERKNRENLSKKFGQLFESKNYRVARKKGARNQGGKEVFQIKKKKRKKSTSRGGEMQQGEKKSPSYRGGERDGKKEVSRVLQCIPGVLEKKNPV